MLYTDVNSMDAPVTVAEEISPSSAVWVTGRRDADGGIGSPQKRCSAIASKQLYPESNRKRRRCVICRWDDRYATEVTDFCVLHNVCLCQHVFETSEPYMCPMQTWTCWEKYHRYYLPRKLFSNKGSALLVCGDQQKEESLLHVSPMLQGAGIVALLVFGELQVASLRQYALQIWVTVVLVSWVPGELQKAESLLQQHRVLSDLRQGFEVAA
ncbi:hypothetical protein PF005_g955 [Phytophthora fragariae]|uniref:Uncharacterized protein n=1 Tax=Phytophthora fragariae TaxID=53985 RepID=A0A6A3ZKT6_9STRA|nr:hypothetical protein PF005_g955 [Phytophthora fragariae]KAE9328238.1 hypothetical protein PF001_g1505 [Phytophthora fragariae]